MHKCKLELVEGMTGTETQRQWCVRVGKPKNDISASPEKLPTEAEKKEEFYGESIKQSVM